MDLMEVRRRVMLSMASGEWKIPLKSYTVDTQLTNGQQVIDDISQKCNTVNFLAVSKRDINEFGQNGVYLITRIQSKTGAVIRQMIRFRDNAWKDNLAVTSYDTSIPIGDEYTVYILDSIEE